MSVFQLTTMVAANMLGAGIIMLPTNLASSWYYFSFILARNSCGCASFSVYFAQAGMFSQIKGAWAVMQNTASVKLDFMASHAYSISLIIANIAIAVSAVGYGAVFGVDLNATQTSQATIVLLWFAAILNFRGNRFTGRLSNMTIWGSIFEPVL